MGRDHDAKGQRSKTSKASSSSAAAMLAASGNSLVTFASFDPNVDASLSVLDSDIEVNLKKLSKRDPLTKTKALTELKTLFDERPVENLQAMLAQWAYNYNLLALDQSRQVREMLNDAHAHLLIRVKKDMAKQLKTIFASWVLLRCDPSAEVATSASKAFTEAFSTGEKQQQAFIFCRKELLEAVDERMRMTVETLSDVKALGDIEAAEKFERVISATLLSLALLLNTLEAEELERWSDSISMLLSGSFWKCLTSKFTAVRSAAYKLIDTLCARLPSGIDGQIESLSPKILGLFSDSESGTHESMWPCILRFISTFPRCWEHVNIRKHVLPRLWSMLRHGGYGSCQTTYMSLLPLLNFLPLETTKSNDFYSELFDALWVYAASPPAQAARADERSQQLKLLLNAYKECSVFGVMQRTDDTQGQLELINYALPCLLRNALKSEIGGVRERDCLSVLVDVLGMLAAKQASVLAVHQWLASAEVQQVLLNTLITDVSVPMAMSVASLLSNLSERLNGTDALQSAMQTVHSVVCCSIKHVLVGKADGHVRLLTEIVQRIGIEPTIAAVFDAMNDTQVTVETLQQQFTNGWLRLITSSMQEQADGSEECAKLVLSLAGLVSYLNIDQADADVDTVWSSVRAKLHELSPLAKLQVESRLISELSLSSVQVWPVCVRTSLLEMTNGWCDELCSDKSNEDNASIIGSILSAAIGAESSLAITDVKVRSVVAQRVISYIERWISQQQPENDWHPSATKLMVMLRLLESLISYHDEQGTRQVDPSLAHGSLLVLLFDLICLTVSLDSTEICEAAQQTWMNISKLSTPMLAAEQRIATQGELCEKANALLCVHAATTHDCAPIAEVGATIVEQVCIGETEQFNVVRQLLLGEDRWIELSKSNSSFEHAALTYALKLSSLLGFERVVLGVPPPSCTADTDVNPWLLLRLAQLHTVNGQFSAYWRDHVSTYLCHNPSSPPVLAALNRSLNQACEMREHGSTVLPLLLKSVFRVPATEQTIIAQQLYAQLSLKSTEQIVQSASLAGAFSQCLRFIVPVLRRFARAEFNEDFLLELAECASAAVSRHCQHLDVSNPQADLDRIASQLHVLEGLAASGASIPSAVYLSAICAFLTAPTLAVSFETDIPSHMLVRHFVAFYRGRNADTIQPTPPPFALTLLASSDTWRLAEQRLIELSTALYTDRSLEDHRSALHENELLPKINQHLLSSIGLPASMSTGLYSAAVTLLSEQLSPRPQSEFSDKQLTDELNNVSTASCPLVTAHFIALAEKMNSCDQPPTDLAQTCQLLWKMPHQFILQLVGPTDTSFGTFLYPLLSHMCITVQTTAYRILHFTAPIEISNVLKQQLALVVREETARDVAARWATEESESERPQLPVLPNDELQTLICDCSVSTGNSQLALMLGWAIVLEVFHSSNTDTQSSISTRIREDNRLCPMLHTLASILPLHKGASKSMERSFDFLAVLRPMHLRAAMVTDADLVSAAEVIYLLCLQTFGAESRRWYAELDRGLSQRVDVYTGRHVSSAILQREVEIMNAATLNNLEIRASVVARQVTATYVQDEAKLEIVIKMSASHPLRAVEVEGGKCLGVSDSKWRKWLLNMTTLVSNRDGRLLDAVKLWQKNLDKEFEGVEDCPICYSILHLQTNQLPRLTCRTCKHKFHSACLYKWFNTAHKSNCPLCQSPF